MLNSLPLTLFNQQSEIFGGLKSGELTILAAARSTGKTLLSSKYYINSVYGKLGMKTPDKIRVKEGYKHEWVVDVPGNKVIEVTEWLYATLGECGHNRKYRWRRKWTTGPEQNVRYDTRFFLRNEQDVMLFNLKWL